MDPARFRRLMDLVGEAVERPEGSRDAWLEEQCGSDVALLTEARSLATEALATSLESLTLRLEARIGRAAARIADEARPLPDRIGPYRISEIIGEGGMGIVYGARQEEPLGRDVAIKVVRAGIHAPDLLRRFEAERRTLASLEHPCIAHIFEAGSTDEGLPYFAMERVRGKPITRFCDDRGLGLEERLGLFRKVLSAVQHAHQKAVVHRDLKPANLLVTNTEDGPMPKIIDFGIARAIAGKRDRATALTAVGTVMGTLEYMSPEQATSPSEGIDTRSDIYSLGVILYELLTGLLPFPGETLRTASPARLERLLLDEDPPLPSERASPKAADSESRARARGTDPRRLVRALRGDLDTIVGMAMHKDPSRRYATVDQLADDIQRYLEGRPVVARPATLSYRARRFVGRHRLRVLGSGAALVLLVGMTGMFTARLAVERDRSRTEGEQALQLAGFLQELFEMPDPSRSLGEAVTVREMLDRGAEHVHQALVGQPEVQARMMRVIGRAYHGLGLSEEARPLLAGSLALLQALYGEEHEEVAAGKTSVAGVLLDMGDLEAAEPMYREALATRQRLFGPEHPRVTESLLSLGRWLEMAGDPVAAEEHFREALDQNRRFHSPGAPELGTTTRRLGNLLRLQGRLDEAEPLLQESLEAKRRHYGPGHPRVASAMRNLAALHRDRGAYAEAEPLYREAVALRRRTLGSDHSQLATSLMSYGLLLRSMGDGAGAAAAFTESIEILDRIHEDPHPNQAAAYHNLALQLTDAGRWDEAIEWFERSGEVRGRTLREDHPERAFPLLGIAWVYMEQQRYEEAEALFREALALRQGGLPAGHRDIGGTLSDLGACLTAQGRHGEAESVLIEAHGILSRVEGPEGRRTRRSEGRLVRLYEAWGRPDEAARWRAM